MSPHKDTTFEQSSSISLPRLKEKTQTSKDISSDVERYRYDLSHGALRLKSAPKKFHKKPKTNIQAYVI